MVSWNTLSVLDIFIIHIDLYPSWCFDCQLIYHNWDTHASESLGWTSIFYFFKYISVNELRLQNPNASEKAPPWVSNAVYVLALALIWHIVSVQLQLTYKFITGVFPPIVMEIRKTDVLAIQCNSVRSHLGGLDRITLCNATCSV